MLKYFRANRGKHNEHLIK